LDHLIKVLQEVMLDASISKHSRRLDSIGALEKSKPKRSSLHVDGICCASEVPQVTSILRQLSKSGVVKVSINITSRLVYVDHHPDEISAVDLARALNKDKFGATVRRDGGARQRIKTIPKALNISNSLNGSIRHIAPNVVSRTIKVEHNPKLVSANSAFMDYGGCENGTVSVDGNIEGLFLPNTMNPDMSEVQSKKWRFAKRLKHFLPKGLGVNIILSGIFWFVSILGHFIEKWSYLQYAGLISVAFGIPPVALKAFRTLKRKHFDANCMMVTAAIGSLLLQEYDEAASVSFLFAISEFLEDQATRRATKALDSIINMRPDHANLLIDPKKDDIEIVPVSDLEIGSLVIVRTGDQVPSDGIVTEGISQIDESSLTGESVLVTKCSGDIVSGGTINAGSSPLKIRITSLVEDSAVSRLVRLIEESASNSSPTEQLVDSFAKSYTPIVIVIAIIMCTVPWLISPEAGRQWTLNGLIIVVIACPCALTISTPVTYAAGLAATAQRGIIVKGGAKLEALGSVKTVIFDKTGTLTEGKFKLTHLDTVGSSKSRREVLSLLSTMEAPSSHPLAATLVLAAKAEGIERSIDTKVLNHTILHGEGVTAIVDGEEVYVGNMRLFDRLLMYEGLSVDDKAKANQWNEEGGTVGFVGVKAVGIVGMFCVADGIRPEARNVVTSLVNDEVKVMMLTGDGDGAAKAVARAVGLPLECVQSRLTPDAKLHCVASELGLSKRTGGLWSKKELLLFVGDGVNGNFELLDILCNFFYLGKSHTNLV
jgi:Cd2+/Zn2+-exporting ATPase